MCRGTPRSGDRLIGPLVDAGELGQPELAPGTPAQYGLAELAAGAGGVVGAAVAGRLSGTRTWVRGTIGGFAVTRTPDAQRGTVGAALNGIARTCSVLALALGGLIGTLASPRAVFIGGGLLGAALVLGFGLRALRAANDEPEVAAAA